MSIWITLDDIGIKLTELIKLSQGPMNLHNWIEVQHRAIQLKNEVNNLKKALITKGGAAE